MRISIVAMSFFIVFQTFAQDKKAVEWINENAVKIEDANPGSDLTIFNNNVPQKFADAKIFGFGETTHQGKEFFDLKTKFFKYLVESQDVKVFIMEDSYTAEAAINEWISGGTGNAETIANNLSIGFWHCKEVVNLLQWMRSYNSNKAQDQQIRFYGMDIQVAKNINHEIRDAVKKYNIPVPEELLVVADSCAEKKVDYMASTDWADRQIPKLKEIEQILLDHKGAGDSMEIEAAVRALTYLIKYTYFVQNNYSQDRDLKMFENVTSIITNKSKNGKAFIWAHNEHINNKGFLKYNNRKIYNLGWRLKEYYKNSYYSIGFDFGAGTLNGYYSLNDEKPAWNKFELKAPFDKTYAKTLFEAKDDIYFIDMSIALSGTSANFFKERNKQIVAGGGGFNPKKNHLYLKKFSEMYDGLIFVKNSTLPTKLGEN